MENIIKTIRDIDIDNISQHELEQLLPRLGMNGECPEELPKHLSCYFNKGIKFWQYPNQFSEYLKKITTYDIKSYLEIGCRWGGTFIITTEILRLKNGNIRAYACDLMPISKILYEYKLKYNTFKYIEKSSFNLTKQDVKEQIDLILLDGDHLYEGLQKDFKTSLSFNPKYIVFHDICSDIVPDVGKMWNEVKSHYKHYEYVQQYDSVVGNYLGIGLIEVQEKSTI